MLVVDVGGTSVKVRATGTRAARTVPSGPALTPRRLVARVLDACADWSFDAVALGYPGPVRGGRPWREPRHLGTGWTRFDFERAFGRPVRCANDAAMQALGSWRGGRMLFLGLGTGLGTALVAGDGRVVAMELAHLRGRGARTYEEDLGAAGLARLGLVRWRRAVREVTAALAEAFLADEVVLGGGNVRRVGALPPGVRRGSNDLAFAGGLALWQDEAAVRFGGKAACPTRPGSR